VWETEIGFEIFIYLLLCFERKMSNLMKAVSFTTSGLTENMSISLRQIPIIKENECLLRVYYSALNRADIMQRKGLYPAPPGESDILGLEAIGVIDQESNNKSKRFHRNDRVMALLAGGGNAEYVAVNEKQLMKIPDWMTNEHAAAIPEVWLTAFQLLYWISSLSTRSNLQDLSILVYAGASGVGTSLIQMAKKLLNIKTIFATVSSEEKRNFLENKLQITKAFNYRSDEDVNFDQKILSLTENKGVDVIFDCVGAAYWEKNLDCLAMDGEWILFGSMSGTNVNGNILGKLLRKRIHLKSTTLRARSIDVKLFIQAIFCYFS
jgi:tumor protein p53-inducible protein 3